MTGVYKITNKTTGLVYIGSSGNIKRRWKTHKSNLKNGTHANKHLQNSWNKHGKSSFEFDVLELCDKKDKEAIEQAYLDNADFSKLYNISTSAYGPSQEYRFNPVVLLDLYGNYLSKFKNGVELAKYVNAPSQLNYSGINNKNIFMRKYRIVTPDFYESEIETIKSWRYFLDYSKERARQKFWETPIYKVTKKDTTLYVGEDLKEASTYMCVTRERARQLTICKIGIAKHSGTKIKKYKLIDVLDEPWFKLRTIYKKLNIDDLSKEMVISKLKRKDWLKYHKKVT